MVSIPAGTQERRGTFLRFAAVPFALFTAMIPGCGPDVSNPAVTLMYEPEFPTGLSNDQRQHMLATISRVLKDRLPVPGSVATTTGGQIDVAIHHPFDRALLPSIRRQLEQYGTLELHVAANHRDHADLIVRAEQSLDNDVRSDDGATAWWLSARNATVADRLVPENYVVRRGAKDPQEADDEGVATLKQVLVVIEPFDVRGEHVVRANAVTDAQGRPSVYIHLNETGGLRMRQLSRRYQPSEDGFRRHLAIVFDNQVLSAPAIEAVIDTDVVIEGEFTQVDVDRIVAVLTTGALPCKLKLVNQR